MKGVGCALKKALVDAGRGCFVAGTRVWLASGGSVPIEQLRPGDQVLAPDDPLDPGSPLGPHQVVKAVVREVSAVVDLTVQCADGRVELLTATLDHPFMVEGKNGGEWRKAGELEPGAVVRAETGQVVVQSSEVRLGWTRVYNLEVERAHAYFVGTARALVHNGGECSGTTAKLSQSESAAIRRITNIVTRNLKPGPKGDIAGTTADMVGAPISKPGGGLYDHVQDMATMLKGLRNGAAKLERSSAPEAVTAKAQAEAAIREIESALAGTGI